MRRRAPGRDVPNSPETPLVARETAAWWKICDAVVENSPWPPSQFESGKRIAAVLAVCSEIAFETQAGLFVLAGRLVSRPAAAAGAPPFERRLRAVTVDFPERRAAA